MIEVLICPKCGANYNSDTYSGLKCRRCGTKLVLTQFPENQEKEA